MTPTMNLRPEELEALVQLIPTMTEYEQKALMKELDALEEVKIRNKAATNFVFFARMAYEGILIGHHHRIIAKAFEKAVTVGGSRIIINMAPRHGKSIFASYLLPAWFLGRYPNKKIIQASHTGELAVDFGRKVRNLIDSQQYQRLFPGVGLSYDSKAAGRWSTNQGGEYFAAGVGANIAGKGADLFIIDDPHSEQDGKSGNTAIFDSAYDWYQTGPRQRLQPNGSIVVVMCMTGDTGVLRPDGTETPLQDIRPGDMVATYRDGALSTSMVVNWKSNGFDSIWQIRTKSGIVVKANERHPFLVSENGDTKWIRVKNLRRGQNMLRVRRESGKEKYVPSLSVVNPLPVEGFASPTIRKYNGQKEFDTHPITPKAIVINDLKSDMVLPTTTITPSLRSRMVNAPCVSNLPEKMLERIGVGNCVLTTAMKPEKLEDSCATTAILLSDMQEHQRLRWPQPSTYDFILDEIIEITTAGVEEVFDVQIAETENFIANGLVSHNTRWNKKDITGRLVDNMVKNEGGDQWEVIQLPMELPSGEPVWPEFWKKEDIQKLKATLDVQYWNAQYQQNPTSEEGALIKREWWIEWEPKDPPKCTYIIMSVDTAHEKNNRADYSAFTIWGVFEFVDDEEKKKELKGKPVNNIILLEAFKERLEFPELKTRAYETWKEWKPDSFIVEKKASGAPLIQELRRMGIPVQEFTPSKGQDKIARVNSISDIFRSGFVWAPQTRWAQNVIDETAEFPQGDHDDYVDSMSQALMRFRQGGFINLNTDFQDELDYRFSLMRRAAYY